jgi:hypothetical protein
MLLSWLLNSPWAVEVLTWLVAILLLATMCYVMYVLFLRLQNRELWERSCVEPFMATLRTDQKLNHAEKKTVASHELASRLAWVAAWVWAIVAGVVVYCSC